MCTFSRIVILFFLRSIVNQSITDAFRNNADECCETGRIEAERTKTCNMALQSLITEHNKNISTNCLFLTHICCLSNLRSYFCEEGLKSALRLLPCNQKKLDSKDSYQICCKCCELGIRAGRDKADCEPVAVLDERCGEQFTNCCLKAKSLNCDMGFQMDDDHQRCRDINECLSNPCPNTMQCENTPGSFRCIEGCEHGYTWSIKHGACRDIDECALNKHNCIFGHRCENMPGSYRCIRERNCGTGYQVDPVTQTCVDVDECEQDIDECGQVMIYYYNRIGEKARALSKCAPQNCTSGEKFNAFHGRCEKIQCRSGFSVTSLGKCVDVNECGQNPSPCKRSERCDNTPGSYRCVQTFTCASGLQMKDLECLDDDECAGGNLVCPINSLCRNTPGSYACDCISGYKMIAERAFCEDINECEISPNTCEQRCINVQGSYYCLCNEGYRLNSDKQTCRDLDECSMIDNLCQYHCVNTLGSYKCICPSGFTIERGRHCQDIDECQIGTHNCLVNDVCVNLHGEFRCYSVQCPQGYEKIANNRCHLSTQWCNEHQNDTNLRCTNDKPMKYVYSFISIPAKIRRPTEIFRIRNSQLNINQHTEFDLRLINVNDSHKNLSQITVDNFQIKSFSPHNAYLMVLKELSPLQEIELEIQMKIFTNKILNSITIMKVLVYINQYNFYP
ncbi:unnamed protein product [Rotaria magnacalcarata]|uniref:EGF-like domain-containing protein n=1 Tax=Rotaria magnacalcarata TaxID=392030 RepID=A0A815BWB0_9BILA|nr:unnamed protein product [Rotaria magnacalcarata]